jgi:uncharacterized protein with ATP-grasp and redox domains
VLVRFPDIAQRTVAENRVAPSHAAAVDRLVEEIVSGGLTIANAPLAPAAQTWVRALRPHVGAPWVEAPWFLTETYFYRRLLMALGYWTPGARTLVDPFAVQKQAGLAASDGLIEALGSVRADAQAVLAASLWANRVDLSLWPTGTEQGDAERRAREVLRAGMAERIIVDDRDEVMAAIASGGRLHVVLDNAGAELVADLVLVAAALEAGGRAVLHAKSHPTFVSDATPDDVVATIDYIAERHAVGSSLQAALAAGRIEIDADPFWVSPHAMWERPPTLARRLAEANLIVVKGDANYRRLLGDRRWEFTVAFGAVVRPPVPLLAIRTIKSEVAAGLASPDPTDGADGNWLINGEWGLIQYAPPVAEGGSR